MSASDPLVWLPVLSAAIWLSVAGYELLQERYRTWTEVFFVALCLCVSAYCLSDAAFFDADSEAVAMVAASASLASLTFAATFIFMYGVTLHTRFRRVLLGAFVPAAFFVATIPGRMLVGLMVLGGGVPPYAPVYSFPWFATWIAFLLASSLAGSWEIYRTYVEIRQQNPKLARRIGAILVGFLVAAVLGSATNALLGLLSIPLPPVFSSASAIPGVLLFSAVSPTSFQRLNDILLRRKSADYAIRGVFLSFSDGTLIGSKTAPGEEMIDHDSFSATLDVIQNYMHTSFPVLRGKWLQSIHHGDSTLVMERGRHVFLTVVLAGRENDQLRRRMRDLLREYERGNELVLSDWRGIPREAKGTDDVLSSLLEEK